MKNVIPRWVLVAALGTGCSGGNWVDVPILKDCSVLKGKSDPSLAGAQVVIGSSDPKETVAFFARATCSNSGKAWTGDARCENAAVQVKCK
jgi:hypothetical protein